MGGHEQWSIAKSKHSISVEPLVVGSIGGALSLPVAIVRMSPLLGAKPGGRDRQGSSLSQMITLGHLGGNFTSPAALLMIHESQ